MTTPERPNAQWGNPDEQWGSQPRNPAAQPYPDPRYPQQGYQQQGYPGYPQQGYQQQGYPGYPQQGYPAYPAAVDVYGRSLSDKSKMAAGLLQIFFGGFGVGRFYLGYTGVGIAQIAASWLTCGIGFIWPLIDGIMILTGSVPDAQGRPLRN